jgi:hypothetical protein
MLKLKRSSHLFALGLALLMPAVCHAQAKCPWINEATARGILGGPVTATASVSDQGAGVCNFLRRQGSVVNELHISVEIMTDIPKQFPTFLAHCPPNSAPLRAIGNEAVMCSTEGKGEPFAEKVVSRVRNQAFVVSVNSSVQDDASMTQQMRRQKANLIAEQVAGILF